MPYEWLAVGSAQHTAVVEELRHRRQPVFVDPADRGGPVGQIRALGVDPIWFGVFVVVMCEIGLITPPVGMNLFVVQGVRKGGGSFNDVIWGSVPFVVIMIIFAALLILVPGIAMLLPDMAAGR